MVMILSDKRGMRTYELIEGLRDIAIEALAQTQKTEMLHVNEICDELRKRIGIEKLRQTRLLEDLEEKES